MFVIMVGIAPFQISSDIIHGYMVGIHVVHWTIICEPPKVAWIQYLWDTT
jgi:hypothetical protein